MTDATEKGSTEKGPTENGPTETSQGDRPATAREGNGLLMRLVYLLLMALLIGVAVTLMHALTVVQYVIMLVDKGRPNAQIADFGRHIGQWLSRAVRFQLAGTEDKPWPWTPLD